MTLTDGRTGCGIAAYRLSRPVQPQRPMTHINTSQSIAEAVALFCSSRSPMTAIPTGWRCSISGDRVTACAKRLACCLRLFDWPGSGAALVPTALDLPLSHEEPPSLIFVSWPRMRWAIDNRVRQVALLTQSRALQAHVFMATGE